MPAPKDFPRCGTCIYWTGKKTVLGSLVEYDMYETGTCGNFDSPAYGKEMTGDDYCYSKQDY